MPTKTFSGVWETLGGRELLSLEGHSAGIWSACFFPDGQRLVSGSYDATAKIWQAASRHQTDAWQHEEEADSQRLAATRREQEAADERDRARRIEDPGVLTRWLILAPIGFAEQDGTAALDREQIVGERRLRPRTGEQVTIGDSGLTWRQVELPDYLIDFNQLLGEVTEWSVAYAVAYVRSERAQHNLLLRVASDDEAKIYINGSQVFRHAGQRTYVAEQDTVQGVELVEGLNVVVFKVVNENGNWQGSIRFTDAAGQPLKGIRVTLDPEGRD